MKLLIGYDGSDYSNFALEDLRRAGLPEDLEAVVLSVGEAWELPLVIDSVSSTAERFVHPNVAVIEDHLAEVSKKAGILAEPAVERLRSMFPEWKVRAEVRCGRPAVEIVKMADEWLPDLLVVGSQGRSAFGRVLLGSVSHKVLHDTICSVRIARKNESVENANVRVLVAVDGSPNAETMVKTVAGRHWPLETEIRLVAVNDPFVRPRTGYISWNMEENKPHDTEESREWAGKVIDGPTEILRSAGLTVTHNMRLGDAANMILSEASDWRANMIFLGARGLGPVKRFVLGSVSSAVVSKATCSVEVIRVLE